VKVLQDGNQYGVGFEGERALVIYPVHNKLLHSLHRVFKLLICFTFPYVAFPHLGFDELQTICQLCYIRRDAKRPGMHSEKLVDQFDLVIDTKRPLGKMVQETARVHHKSAHTPAQQALNAPSEVLGNRFCTPRLELVQEPLEIK